MTEVRPEAYYDDLPHFEMVRTVIEENELVRSSEDLNDLTNTLRQRKLSVQSEEPEYVASPTSAVQKPEVAIKRPTPTLSIRQETQSTESKDTLTPLEHCDEKTLMGDSGEDLVDLNNEGLRQRAVKKRNSAMGRRNSESVSNYDINKSQNSLINFGGFMCKRQYSLTQSEPDTENNAPVRKSKLSKRFLLTYLYFTVCS